ncbi:hypothetical protein BASA50_000492 [Batrachochytrium salamandrivorans]|uniref:C2H2-type domain-containing protein n=1 Tax=Batrachochytrium salamandrivorans TaxID=1357716 RepID=A0ABQ8ETZ1_9FUNG|nr:hypothetical protein BASA60_011397 [Batrachochytrium salamandrivorans]KAH6568115.1 hypothetical protein BASA62_005662 [Batrachochytrium salamandrivorans]KAH6586538.1 hypothetical protein BASA50_000492 [Batrachochytrium salamandrivorans]KAH6592878.1 hypothetical protein BASA61_004427 [Batrachochytrium salamandrivorans]KAH9275394.1 hypothetical protein BASA83_002167 [Batrachochytrium salamandrivorans]
MPASILVTAPDINYFGKINNYSYTMPYQSSSSSCITPSVVPVTSSLHSRSAAVLAMAPSATKPTTLRQHRCTSCPLSFLRSEHLARHRLTHSGRKPFSCDGCHRGFARLDALQRHQKMHKTGLAANPRKSISPRVPAPASVITDATTYLALSNHNKQSLPTRYTTHNDDGLAYPKESLFPSSPSKSLSLSPVLHCSSSSSVASAQSPPLGLLALAMCAENDSPPPLRMVDAVPALVPASSLVSEAMHAYPYAITPPAQLSMHSTAGYTPREIKPLASLNLSQHTQRTLSISSLLN